MTNKEAKMIAHYLAIEMKEELHNIAQEAFDEYLDSHEAAEYLRISYNTFKKKMKDIPSYRPEGSRKVLFSKIQLKQYIT